MWRIFFFFFYPSVKSTFLNTSNPSLPVNPMNNTNPMAVSRTIKTITNSRLFIEYKRMCTDLQSNRKKVRFSFEFAFELCIGLLIARILRSRLVLTVRIGRDGKPVKCIGWNRWTNRWIGTPDFWSSSDNCPSVSCNSCPNLLPSDSFFFFFFFVRVPSPFFVRRSRLSLIRNRKSKIESLAHVSFSSDTPCYYYCRTFR